MFSKDEKINKRKDVLRAGFDAFLSGVPLLALGPTENKHKDDMTNCSVITYLMIFLFPF